MANVPREQIVALGKDPISPTAPSGESARYEDAFSRLQAQIDRLGSLDGKAVEWNIVVELSTELLKTKSKDLLVLTYLTIGLFEQHGYAGLAAALEMYREFLKNFWETCFPKVKPPAARLNAVQYMIDRIQPDVDVRDGKAKRHPESGEKEAVHDCATQVDELAKQVDTAFTGQPSAPNIMPFVRALRALKEKVGPLVSEAPPAAAAPAGQPAAGAPAAPSGGGVAVPESFTTPTQAIQAVVRVAKYLLQQDNKDARGYRLMRAIHFGGFVEPPKDRLLPPPPAPRRQFFENTAGSGDWNTLLTEAEGQFAVTPVWLDLQRYVGIALRGLGAPYAAAYHAVASDTVALASRLPAMFELSFKDGSAFADGSTKAWLDEMRAEFGGGGGGGGGGAAANGDIIAAAQGEARKLLGAGKQPDAIAHLAQVADGTAGRRQRFRAQLALAGMCLDINRVQLAGSILEGLETQIERYQLEDWEPELAAEVWRQLLDYLRRAKPKPDVNDVKRIADVFARLCRLNPAVAMTMDEKK